MSNDKTGFILTASKMWPGGTPATGTVKIGNTGDGTADFYLKAKGLTDTLGTGSGNLSEVLVLTVTDDATPAKTVYTGKLTVATLAAGVNVGTFAGGDSHTYTFSVAFPDSDLGSNPATKGSDDKYQGCKTVVEFDWEAVSK